MEPNADQLEFIDSKTNLASNPARYEVDVPEVAKPKPVVVIGPNAVYLNVPGAWDKKVGEIAPPEPTEPPPTEPPPIEEAGPPVLDKLDPAELSVSAPDTTVLLKGTGFTEESVIIWNGGEEVTNFGDPTTLSTLVKPSTVSPELPLPFSVPVLVRTGDKETTEQQFTFVP